MRVRVGPAWMWGVGGEVRGVRGGVGGQANKQELRSGAAADSETRPNLHPEVGSELLPGVSA